MRPRKRSRRLPAASIALIVVFSSLVACSSGGSESARPSAAASSSAPTPNQALIAWVGQVCAADKDFTASQHAARIAALSLVPRRPTRKQIATFVNAIHRGLQEDVRRFERIGTSPVAGGDQVVAAYVAALKTATAKAKRAKETVSDRSSPDIVVSGLPQSLANALESAVPRSADLPRLLARNPALDQAFKAAHSCKGATPLSA